MEEKIVMNTIYFRYNKHSHYLLYFMVIFGIVVGLVLDAYLLNISGITKGPEFTPDFLRGREDVALYIIFGSIPIAMLLPTFFAYRFWGKAEEKASIRFWEDHAILYYRNKEMLINRGKVKIDILTGKATLYDTYKVILPERKIYFHNSIIEKKEKKGKVLSLDIAMQRLVFFEEKKGKIKVSFYGLNIILERTTPEIFDNSPYYLDYGSIVEIKEGNFATCLIRERKNPIHVVGDLEIDTSFFNENEVLNENNLRKQPILAVIELDEQISLD